MNQPPDNSDQCEASPEEVSVSEIFHELSEGGVESPPLWRQLVPYAITIAILCWIFRDIDFQDFLTKLSNARLRILLPAMFGFTAIFSVCDLMSYGIVYRWFAVPSLTLKEIINVRWGCYLLQVLYAPLEVAAIFAYLRRHKGVPVTWSMSASSFPLAGDVFVINAVLTAAVAINVFFEIAPELDAFWLFPLSIVWIAAFIHFRYWFSDSKDKYFLRFSQHPLLRAFRLATPEHYIKIYAVRATEILSAIVAHGIALHAFGIDVPITVVGVVAPFVFIGAFLPISGGGFGGPQLIALILLPYAGYDEALIAAYSMSFSACFTLGRTIIGAIFLPNFLRDLKDKVPAMTVDPITGEAI